MCFFLDPVIPGSPHIELHQTESFSQDWTNGFVENNAVKFKIIRDHSQIPVVALLFPLHFDR